MFECKPRYRNPRLEAGRDKTLLRCRLIAPPAVPANKPDPQFLIIVRHRKVSTYFGGHLMHQSTQKQKVQRNSRLPPRRPTCPSRAFGWSSLTTPWGFPCCVRFPCVHAVATTPAQRLGVLFALLHPAVSAFPERVVGSACAASFSRFARRLLALRPAHSRCHQFVTRIPKASAISLPP